MEQFSLTTDDGAKLSLQIYDIEAPAAVVQIVHGMEEHQGRYEDFAAFLNKCGYCVVTSDLRGHGSTAELLGHFSDNGGDLLLPADQSCIREFIAQRYKGVPVYLFAHSMGTIISRVLLQNHSLGYDKVVLAGYPCYQSAAYFALMLAGIVKLFRGAKHKSRFIQQISVGGFNKAVPSPATKADWICTDEEVVRRYLDDPYCGKGFTCSAFSDLYRMLIQMHKTKEYTNVNKQLRVLMLRGCDDPCTGSAKGAAGSLKTLEQAGFSDIRHIEYKGMRHELINEKQHDKVYADIAAFFNE